MATAIGRLTNSITRQYPLPDLLSIRLPLAILLILPIFAPMLLPSSRLLSLAVTAGIFVILANGLHVIFSHTGQLSLAHTTLWGLGAYTAALLSVHYNWPTAALIPAAGISAALGAVVIGIPAFRTAGFSFAIITFASAEILRLVGNNWSSLTNGSIGITVLAPPSSIGSIEFNTFDLLANFYYLTLAFVYLSLVGIFLIRQSSLGRTFIAIRENESLARSVGINVYLYKLIAFAISGFYAGVAGVFLMYHQKHIEPGPLSQFGAFFTIQFLLMILIGGRFSMLGPTIGAIIAVFGPVLINVAFGDVLDSTRIQIIFGGGLVLTVLFSPNGVAGQTKQRFGATVDRLRRYQERRQGANGGRTA
ncbi:MAG: branched-chain amino acid ABC transporter permease [Chloroflexi bacterium]|nr:branched-chain amino acid ABC transporter permease [Chloroflexota bacterium]